jgi:MYXO-CTERM domain-containing protein
MLAATGASAQSVFTSGDLLVTTSTYAGTASTVMVGSTQLAGATAGETVLATSNGQYSQVFSNANTDPAFGVTSPITLEELTPSGQLVATFPIAGAVTSFSSKSEMGIHLTSDQTGITFTGYNAPVNSIDVSNSNTPTVTDPTNPVTVALFGAWSRVIITLNADGSSTVTPTDAYSGNNMRAAILDDGVYYLVGNAGNSGSGPTAATQDLLSSDTGVQLLAQGSAGPTTVVGKFYGTPGSPSSTGDQYGFSITQLGDPADKTGKDDNFRGETIYNNTLYVSKGSGSNGVNTVYQVGTAGSLPTASTASSLTISILPGFSQTLAKGTQKGTIYYPFGLFFANANTLYVADEGGQTVNDEVGGSTYATNTGGLQKWTYNTATSMWSLAYTLTAGLNLGQPYTVSGSVTDSTGSVIQYVDGLRHLAGVVSADGTTVTFYATTSTINSTASGSTGLGDAGAAPNQLVTITDTIGATTLPANESFTVLQTAAYGQVLRGVSFVPTVLPTTKPVSIAESASTVQSGQTATLTATPGGTGPFTYQWYTGTSGNTASPIGGATSAAYTTAALSATTSYWVEVTTANGIIENSPTTTITVSAANSNVPVPPWALGVLGLGLLGAAARRRSRPG